MMFLYKLGRFFYLIKIPLIPKIFQGLIYIFFNSKISCDSTIGNGSIFVCRGVSIVLIPGTRIGTNCVIGLRFSTVRNFPYKEVPRIGNNVWIGPNVIIAGPVIIEDYVIIAGNSFVNKSIPSGSIVAGNPAKIIGRVSDLEYNVFDNPKYKDGIAPFLEHD